MSRTDHPRIRGTHRALTREWRYDPEHDEDLMPRRRVSLHRVPDADAIAQGLTDYASQQIGPAYGTPEFDIECERVGLSLLNGEILSDLRYFEPDEYPYEYPNHPIVTNHLRSMR